MALLEASPERCRGVSRASDNLAGGTESLSLCNLLGLLAAHKSWGSRALGSLCPQLSALVSLCSGVFVPCVPRPALSFPWDEGSLCMAKQGRGAGSHHRAHGPVQSRQPQAKWDCTSGQLWAPHHSPKELKAVEHWAASTPFLPHPVLSIPSRSIPPHPAACLSPFRGSLQLCFLLLFLSFPNFSRAAQ